MLTPKEADALKEAYSRHRETQRQALALKRQLERIHQEQIMTPLTDAIASEGACLGVLVDLARDHTPNPPDPEELREAAREAQWGCGQ